MEVVVENTVGIPEGSILSIRAGAVRRQGTFPTDKPIRFAATSPLDASPFKVDIFAPLGSSRLVLKPKDERYSVSLGPGSDGVDMSMDLLVKTIENGEADQPESRPDSRLQRKQKAMTETQEYMEEHGIVHFVQNLMASVLAEKPKDPFAYIEQHMRGVRASQGSGEPDAAPDAAPEAPAAAPVTPSERRKSQSKALPQGPQQILTPCEKDFHGPAFVTMDFEGKEVVKRSLAVTDLMTEGTQAKRLLVHSLKEDFSSMNIPTPLGEMISVFQTDDKLTTPHINFSERQGFFQFMRAGPRETLHFDPKGVVATIVTCGGLCPGLNAVIREIVMMLTFYGVKKIWGIKGGYKGVVQPENWIELTPELVQDIHNLGGTILVSDRGNPTEDEQSKYLIEMGVQAHFILGGDGTHKGAYDMYEMMKKKGYQCAVVGVPKTIDNDIPMLDRTFGFDTACTEAAKAIDAAYVEATCNQNCMGLVKLMGRSCGFIVQNACLAARRVDLVLLPEMEISLDKVLSHCLNLMQTKGYCVVVVAEGCGDTLIKSSGETDAGGNIKLADVGPWLKKKIEEKFKQVKLPLSIKYIDPTYMIRAVAANANDSVYCTTLAHSAVHAAMAGFTGITVAQIHQHFVLLPIQCVTKQRLKRVDVRGKWFQELMATTTQPDVAPDGYVPPLQEPEAADALADCMEIVDPTCCVKEDEEVRRLELEHLGTQYGEKDFPCTIIKTIGESGLQGKDSWVTQPLGMSRVSLQMLKAGPRRSLHFVPEGVAATIVTCGGLCPGLNSVIRELVMMLYNYGVKKVYGIKGGYKGVVNAQSWVTLNPENVQDIHYQGGSILVSDRGNPPHIEMAKMLQRKGVRQHFVLGGDGTQKGAYQTYEQMQKIGWECAVVGIPKTIDNDINLLDRSFGFDTALTEAEKAIDVAYVEATCNANCIGLVKLMGRHCGYLTMMSVLAARHVDICLLPEMDINMDKVNEHCVNLLNNQGHAVVVIAEGCGDTLMKGSEERDAGGNKKLADVGLWLKDQITAHFKEERMPLTIKYVDPTYMVRGVRANANDSIYCAALAQAAVHAAMAGYTGVTVGKVNSSLVYLPIKMITSLPSRTVDIHGRLFERLLATTGQPNFGNVGVKRARPANPSKDVPRTPISMRKSTRGLGGLLKGLNTDNVRVPNTSIAVVDGYGQQIETRALQRDDVLLDNFDIRTLTCFHLSERWGKFDLPSPLVKKGVKVFCDGHSWVTQAMFLGERLDSGKGTPYMKMIRAGPRAKLHFDPNDPASAAAIVSCGGICPGLNSVIREIVLTLWAYGVRKIYGVRGGYKGVVEPENWIQLTPELVKDIHLSGGTMLISDRGNPPHIEMAKTLQSMGVRQYFVLGGDGTHKGAMQTFDCCLEIDHECAVIGVPKTIDNDVPMFDQTFGFDTACTEAVKSVESAYVEARCNANCIGLVKLMGRHCGFIAMNAALAGRSVDICLLPEMQISLEKVLKHVEALMAKQGYAVIVVAEGCGDTLIQSTGGVDAGGNKVLADVGPWLKDQITARFKQLSRPLTIKYIDPTYMIRSVPANSFDSAYCSVLGQVAVHGAMAGYSGVTVGKVYEKYVYVPIHAITQQVGKRVNPRGRWFARLLETTKQPDFSPDDVERPPSTAGRGSVDVLQMLSTPGSINDILQPGDQVKRLHVVNVGEKFPSANIPNTTQGALDTVFIDDGSWSSQTFSRLNQRDDRGHVYYQMLRSGPRSSLHFDPAASSAVLVTCGGLCPGLNSVIREIVMTLNSYGVKRVFGCVGGYKGMVKPESWIELSPQVVQDIHTQGGTMLVSDRGNPPHIEIAKTLQRMSVKQYFVIGGDGTQTGAFDTFTCTQEIGHEVAVVGVPKTIDNDIPILDRSFGFNTACEEAEKAIDAAYVEASCGPNCIGLVKLMGRHCGFIAMHATLAARSVDICMIPEMDISLPRVLSHAMHLVKTRGHAVIVVAEGCGDTLLQSSSETDSGGNKKMADVGPWLRDQLLAYFKKMKTPLSVKYIDPTYTIRAVPANANDSVYCSVLAQHAVHNAMAGYTGVVVGKVDERYVMLPTHAITRTTTRRVDLKGRVFERLIATTGQPNLAPGPGDDWALLPPPPKDSDEDPRPEGEHNGPLPELDHIPGFEQEPAHRRMSADAAAEPPEGVKIKIIDGFGKMKEDRDLVPGDVLNEGDEVRKLKVVQLPRNDERSLSAAPIRRVQSDDYLGAERAGGHEFLDGDSWAVQAFTTSDRLDSGSGVPYYQMTRAGPRQLVYWDLTEPGACAAVVTCGGLCPGENVVIRGIVHSLTSYGVQSIYGIRNGFSGIPDVGCWEKLDLDFVQDIHTKGGTVLASERHFPPVEVMAAALKERKVRQLFLLGGDGSLKGMQRLLEPLLKDGYLCSCVAIPSTINNDIPMVDTTFGFDTACTEARDSVDAAYVEATCNANCIGLVKLLGRDSGFLALTATIASRHVDICLLPEMEISIDKVCDHCEHLMSTKGYAVIVVADGAGSSLLRHEGEAHQAADVGPWLRDQILGRFKSKSKPLTIKYIDPTYMVRSVAANAFDAVYCSTLAEHAVHGAMAGLTAITVAKSYGKYVYLPVQAVTLSQKRVNPNGRWFGRMVFTTKQPNFEPDGFEYSRSEHADFSTMSSKVALQDVLRAGVEVSRLECAHLSYKFEFRNVESPLKKFMTSGMRKMFITPSETWSLQAVQRRNSAETEGRKYLQMLRSGPRERIHFDPKEPGSAAAIVTCGGLCPGLNSVIREVVKMLHEYGVEKVYGIIGGFKGCVKEDKWIELTDEYIQNIHLLGGSVLVSDRGNPPHSEIAQVMKRRNVRQYFVLGGDGSHEGAMESFDAMTEIAHECAVVGVPKTIDNDITLLDQTFGFDTACTEARRAIESAYTEATTNANCIGLVKLMGRHCGWIASTATIAAQTVDICLIPEMSISMPKFLSHVTAIMKRKKYAVIVVAEGCGDTIISSDGGTDAGGNKLLADVGGYLKDQITSHCKQEGIPITIKYIDPTYMIRSVPANAFDSFYCSVLAQQAVHAAMAGYTGITVGKVDERYVMLPIHAIVHKGARVVNKNGATFDRLITTTGQPSFEP